MKLLLEAQLSCSLSSHLSYSDEIVPSKSSFSIKPTCVELRLKKVSRVQWKALERPQHSLGITVTNSNSSQLTNQIQNIISNRPIRMQMTAY